MKVFYESNLAKWLLWQGYSTITLGCFVFTKKTKEEMKQRVLNHEAIHVRQWEECMIASAILLTLVMLLTGFSVWMYLLCPLWSICSTDWNMSFLVFTIFSKVYMERMGTKYRMGIQRSKWRQNPMK